MFATTIRLGSPKVNDSRVLHIIGVSSVDNHVYIYQLQDGVHPKSLFVLYKVNPIIPESWQRVTEFESYNEIIQSQAAFNRNWTQIAFRFVQHAYVGKKYNGFVLFELSCKSRSWWPLPRYHHTHDSDLMTGKQKIVETSIGWLAIVKTQGSEIIPPVCALYKIFPETETDPVLLTIHANLTCITVSFDHVFYTENKQLMLMVRRLSDFKVDTELSICTPLSKLSLCPEFTTGSPHPVCLICHYRYDVKYMYSVMKNDEIWQLNYICQCSSSNFKYYMIESLIGAYGPYPFVLFCLNYPKYETDAPSMAMVNLSVPTLKHFSTLAVQKLFGMKMDKNDDFYGGITENELKKIIGYSKEKNLF